ncbi:MAG TPA: hypothetical protein VJ960_01750 [Oceanipulchritudo sp.]|nr:hypothetical protein [Oceanipulchritudo sp.]
MKKAIHILIGLLSCAGLLTALAGCGGEASESARGAAASELAAVPAFVLTSAPADPMGVVESFSAADSGETITVTGRVGGMASPITAGYAAFVLADESLLFCDEVEGDSCPQPWDACCEDPAKIKASRVLVQFVDEAGMPLPVDLREVTDLKENRTVTVKGRFAGQSTPESPIILAEGLYLAEEDTSG